MKDHVTFPRDEQLVALIVGLWILAIGGIGLSIELGSVWGAVVSLVILIALIILFIIILKKDSVRMDACGILWRKRMFPWDEFVDMRIGGFINHPLRTIVLSTKDTKLKICTDKGITEMMAQYCTTNEIVLKALDEDIHGN